MCKRAEDTGRQKVAVSSGSALQKAWSSPGVLLAAPPGGGCHQRPALGPAHDQVAQRSAQLRRARAQLRGRLLRPRFHSCMTASYIMLMIKALPLHADAAEGRRPEGTSMIDASQTGSQRLPCAAACMRTGSASLTLGIIRRRRWLRAGFGQGVWHRGDHAGHTQAAHGAEV